MYHALCGFVVFTCFSSVARPSPAIGNTIKTAENQTGGASTLKPPRHCDTFVVAKEAYENQRHMLRLAVLSSLPYRLPRREIEHQTPLIPSSSHLEADVIARLVNHLARLLELVEGAWDEALPAEAGVNRHEQDDVDLVQDVLRVVERGGRVEHKPYEWFEAGTTPETLVGPALAPQNMIRPSVFPLAKQNPSCMGKLVKLSQKHRDRSKELRIYPRLRPSHP